MLTTGAQLVVDVLRSEGVTHLFGNPGSTELGLMDAIAGAPDIRYVLGLHESSLIAMADGYAQATGRPAVVNVHTMSGLGNAMGALTNAKANGTPLVVTAGQQHEQLLYADPLLSFDLEALARPVAKWSHEVRNLDELGPMLRRAFLDAATPPAGPVFLSLPVSLLDAAAEISLPMLSTVLRRPVAPGISELAGALGAQPPGAVAIVAAQEVAHAGAIDALRLVAEDLGARVLGGAACPVGVFPPAHPLWHGWLPPSAAGIRTVLADYAACLFVGGQAFLQSVYTPGGPLPEGVEFFHLSPDPAQVGRAYSVNLGLVGDPDASLRALHAELTDRGVRPDSAALAAAARVRVDTIAHEESDARASYGPSPLDPAAAVHALLRAMPDDTVVVDEAITNGVHVKRLHRWEKPGSLYSAKQIIGWGLGAGIGIGLATGGQRPILCISGDGSALFGAQAMWTAAHERVPLVYAILVNQEYGILKRQLLGRRGNAHATGRTPGVDLADPVVDFVALAHSMGLAADAVAHADEIAGVVEKARATGLPHVVVVPVTSAIRA